jgi:hypothetical protein
MGKLIYNKTFKGTIVDTAPRAAAPTITPTDPQAFFNKVTFTITNNEAATATIFYGLEARPRTNFVVLAGNATSDEFELGGDLQPETQSTVNAVAQTSGKLTSVVESEPITSGFAPFFITATGGTTLEYDLDSKRYRSHTFTTSGNFEVTEIPLAGTTQQIEERSKLDYLIIAGGAGGGSCRGGGGAGGYRTTNGISGGNSAAEPKVAVTLTSYSVIVGAGGASFSTNGSPSLVEFSETITSKGGGSTTGGANSGIAFTDVGSGGGSCRGDGIPPGIGTPGQGTDGGNGFGSGFSSRGGGGGGAGGAGGNAISSRAGDGGNGLNNTLRNGTPEPRGGGGGGSGGTVASRAKGTAGGGSGLDGTPLGAPNTGGGGLSNNPTGGGSGIVVIRYEIEPSV